MRMIVSLFWVVFASFLLLHNPLHAQVMQPAVIEGRIVSEETGMPLQRAHVFLSGTKIGTITNDAGRFRLDRVTPGAYRLTISKIGYGRVFIDLLVREGESTFVNRRLVPVVYEMSPLYVDDLDEDWEKNLERFHRLFIGETKRADSVEILNPEVLRFETSWWGSRLEAEARAPLIIENRALGYRITYFLNDFRHSGYVTRWDGEPLFEELMPEDSVQAEWWEKNRKEAFYGSRRHFLLSLINNRVRDEGFMLFRKETDPRNNVVMRRRRAVVDRLITPDEDMPVYKLNYRGQLEVIYTDAPEDIYYIRWARDIQRAPTHTQTSYMTLNRRPLTIDQDGSILETYGSTVYGYFSFRRVALLTPREYRPDNLDLPAPLSQRD